MKIVIDIPEEDYQKLKAKDKFYDMYLNYYEKLIVNGTPLPKGHGRLIDENKLKEEAIRCEWSRPAYDMLDHTLSYIKPIIDADKGESQCRY